MPERTYGFIHAPEKNRRHPSAQAPKAWWWFVEWLGLAEPADDKDCGWYVLGTFQRTTVRHTGEDEDCTRLHRNKAGAVDRNTIAIDADTAKPTFVEDVRGVLGTCAAVFYTTWSHTPENPRWRLLLPLSRDVTPTEYTVIAKVLTEVLGSDQIDKGSTEPWRMMHRPSAPRDKDGNPSNGYAYHVFDGTPLDADEWLASAELLGITAQQPDEEPSEYEADMSTEPTAKQREKAEGTLSKAVRYAPDLRRPDDHKDHRGCPNDEHSLCNVSLGRNQWVIDWGVPLLSLAKGGCLDTEQVKRVIWDALAAAPGDESWDWAEYEDVFGNAWDIAHPTRPDVDEAEDDFDPVPVAKLEPVAYFRIAEAHHPGKPMGNARLLLRRCPPMRRWRGGWYVYRDGVYVSVSDEWVRTVIYHAFEGAYYTTDERTYPWDPTPASVNSTLDALGAVSMVDDNAEPDTSRVNLTNGLLDLDTGVLVPHSDQVFSVVQLPYAYDENATCPEWILTLKDVFEDDPDAATLVQEMFGYIVSGRTDLQKIFYLLGPRRGFKGTMIRMMTALVGSANVASPTLSSYAREFGMAGLIGKTLATTADARFGRSTDIQTVTERWLTISGEDSISVPRKHRDDWVGTLGARIVVASNEAPPFHDASVAVVSRLVLVRFTKSYLGREDHHLTERLLKELPGILNWSLDGLDRLNENRGRFTMPASSLALARELEEESSPVAAFVKEACVVDGKQKVLCSEFIDRLNWWLVGRGDNAMTSKVVGMAVRSACPSVDRKLRGPKGGQEWHYIGIGWT